MSWSIAEVARASGASARTLRHYDAIGLLPPAWTAPDGRRHYEREQLLRLQRILLLRDLGLGLPAVADVLRQQDRLGTVEVLRRHQGWLLDERARLDRVLRTVESTIGRIEEGTQMTIGELFDGFDRVAYETEARKLWGDDGVDAAVARIEGWSAEEALLAQEGYQPLHAELAALRDAGVPVHHERTQGVVRRHYEVTCLFWTPDAEAYRNLGELYVSDDAFRRTIGEGDDALVEYLRDAMAVFAETALS